MRSRYRIALIEWRTAFGDKVQSPSVQKRVAFFWWVTLTHCESVKQAHTYIGNIEKKPPEKIIKILMK